MKKYDREHYVLREFKEEQFMLEWVDEDTGIQKEEYSNSWEELYAKAKKEAKKGNKCTIWDLRFQFIP